jgi:hypothetical protein
VTARRAAGSVAPATVAELQAALGELADLPPVDRARLAPVLIDAAKGVLSRERGLALLEARDAGWTVADLARTLGVHRSKIDDAIALARRSATARGGGGRRGPSRSRTAGQLAARLSAETGVPVQVRWDSSGTSARRGRGGWAWHVDWSDGPTRDQMRDVVDRVAGDYPAIDAGELVYQRMIQPAAVALAMIRNLRAGRPPLGEHRHEVTFWQQLHDEVPYPERGTDEEQDLADRLGRLTKWADHEMAELLATHGLGALTGDLPGDGTVVPLSRPPAPPASD